MDSNVNNDVLNLEVLEARLEMESAAAAVQPSGGNTTPVCICHF